MVRSSKASRRSGRCDHVGDGAVTVAPSTPRSDVIKSSAERSTSTGEQPSSIRKLPAKGITSSLAQYSQLRLMAIIFFSTCSQQGCHPLEADGARDLLLALDPVDLGSRFGPPFSEEPLDDNRAITYGRQIGGRQVAHI